MLVQPKCCQSLPCDAAGQEEHWQLAQLEVGRQMTWQLAGERPGVPRESRPRRLLLVPSLGRVHTAMVCCHW
jgi:hypothetical protein